MSSDEKEKTASEIDAEAMAPADEVPTVAAESAAQPEQDPPPAASAEPETQAEQDAAAVPAAGFDAQAGQDHPPPAGAGRSVLGIFGWVFLLALIVLLGAGAYYWQQKVYPGDLATLREQIAALSGAQAQVSAEIDATTAEIGTAATGVDALSSKIDRTAAAQGELQRSVSALYEKETQTSVDWILAEAEYLVLAATQRLALERDVDTALAALRAADQRLRSAEHPDLIPIRDQIIQDVTALEAVNLPDIEGLAIYLAKTVGQIDALPTKPIAEEVTPFTTVREGEYKAQDWRRLGYAMWSDLVELVEVKDADLPDSVLFDPELRYFLQQNLKLELASARLAVMRRDRANLDASVALIKRQLEAYYDINDTGVANIIKRLDGAKALDLVPALPSITGSLDVIRKHRAERAADNTGPTP